MVDFPELSNKRTNSVRTNEELLHKQDTQTQRDVDYKPLWLGKFAYTKSYANRLLEACLSS